MDLKKIIGFAVLAAGAWFGFSSFTTTKTGTDTGSKSGTTTDTTDTSTDPCTLITNILSKGETPTDAQMAACTNDGTTPTATATPELTPFQQCLAKYTNPTSGQIAQCRAENAVTVTSGPNANRGTSTPRPGSSTLFNWTGQKFVAFVTPLSVKNIILNQNVIVYGYSVTLSKYFTNKGLVSPVNIPTIRFTPQGSMLAINYTGFSTEPVWILTPTLYGPGFLAKTASLFYNQSGRKIAVNQISVIGSTVTVSTTTSPFYVYGYWLDQYVLTSLGVMKCA